MYAGVVLLAAGSGRRVGGEKPKQFLTLGGQPLFLTSLQTFLSIPSIREITIVCQPRYQGFIHKWVKNLKAKIQFAEGGAYRGLSVRNGMRALSHKVDVVLVHDSARPLVTRDVVMRVLAAALKTGAALAAWPLPDTLKLSSKNGLVKKTIPRKNLWLAQTPQGFRRDVALECLLRPSRTATDDVELAERRGYKVAIVSGNATNFKVTYPSDLKLCRLLMS